MSRRAKSFKSQIAELFRVERFGNYKAAKWYLDATFRGVDVPDGYYVQHCGHPTANWPYTGHTPDGDMIVSSCGKAFRHLGIVE